jgi:hypothetical protein
MRKLAQAFPMFGIIPVGKIEKKGTIYDTRIKI